MTSALECKQVESQWRWNRYLSSQADRLWDQEACYKDEWIRREALVTEENNRLETLWKCTACGIYSFSQEQISVCPESPCSTWFFLRDKAKLPFLWISASHYYLWVDVHQFPNMWLTGQDIPMGGQFYVLSLWSRPVELLVGIGGWLTTLMNHIFSSCSQFSCFRKIFAPWQRNVIIPSYNGFP